MSTEPPSIYIQISFSPYDSLEVSSVIAINVFSWIAWLIMRSPEYYISAVVIAFASFGYLRHVKQSAISTSNGSTTTSEDGSRITIPLSRIIKRYIESGSDVDLSQSLGPFLANPAISKFLGNFPNVCSIRREGLL